MKGLLCACLLVSLQSMGSAQAYEADIHFSTSYVLARAVGWSEADALIIASANQGVDENQDTVAALEVDTALMSSLHQAEKNLRFHCFSETHGPPGRISSDVLKVMSAHFAEVPVHEDPRGNARRLIALGVALHCQQDAYAHEGFGGSCGAYPGSCYGHSHQTLLDQVVFGLLGKHLFNPDHPGVSGGHLLEVFQGTVRELAARLPKTSLRSMPSNELVALSDALRGSGLELTDDARLECNRYIAGKWLFDFFHSGGGKQVGPDSLEKLAPEVAVTCKNSSLASATVVKIPAPRFPRLKADASPYLVRSDGSYQLLQGNDFDASMPGIGVHRIADLISNYNTHKVKLQLSHWSHLLALPLMTRVALTPIQKVDYSADATRLN